MKIGVSSEARAFVSEILSKKLIDDCTVLHELWLLLTERLPFVAEGNEERNGKGGRCGERFLQSCFRFVGAMVEVVVVAIVLPLLLARLLLFVIFCHQCMIGLVDFLFFEKVPSKKSFLLLRIISIIQDALILLEHKSWKDYQKPINSEQNRNDRSERKRRKKILNPPI